MEFLKVYGRLAGNVCNAIQAQNFQFFIHIDTRSLLNI